MIKPLQPYRAYHFKDNHRHFEFVCINQIDFHTNMNDEYRIMYINYYNDLIKDAVKLTKELYGWRTHQCGEIDGWIMVLEYVSPINNKTKRIKNYIRLAKMITC